MLKELGIEKQALSPMLAMRAANKALEKTHKLNLSASRILDRIDRSPLPDPANLDFEDLFKLLKRVRKNERLVRMSDVMTSSADKYLAKGDKFRDYAIKKLFNPNN